MEELNEEVVESKKGLTGRSEGKSTILIPGEIESVSKRGVTVAAGTVYDYKQKKFQQDINEEVVEGLQQLTDDVNDNVKHTLSDHSSEIEEINESLEENIPYVIVYENQTVNILCDPYGTYAGSEQEIGTIVKLYRGNIQKEIEYDASIAIDSPMDKGFTTSVEEDGSAIISIPYTDISNLDDTTDVDFHILSQGKAYYGKVIFNKVKRGKSAFELWKDEHPEIVNPTIDLFLAELKNTDNIKGPKYLESETAKDNLPPSENALNTIYFVPQIDSQTNISDSYKIYLFDSNGDWCELATRPGDITNYAGIYDVSEDNKTDNQPKKYSGLSEAIADIVTKGVGKGGMTIKFIQGTGTDAKYVQYRYLSTSVDSADFANEANWQGIGGNISSNNLARMSDIFNVTYIKTPIDTSSLEEHNYIVWKNPNNNTVSYQVSNTNPAYKSKFIPVVAGEEYIVEPQEGKAAVINFVQDESISGVGQLVSYATGYSYRVVINAGNSLQVTIPSDCKSIFAQITSSQGDITPIVSTFRRADEKDSVPTKNSTKSVESNGVFEAINVENEIDLSQITEYTGYYLNQNGDFVENASRGFKIVEVGEGETISILANDNFATFYACFSSFNFNNGDIQFAITRERETLSAENSVSFVAPAGTKYLYIFTRNTELAEGNELEPANVSILKSVKDVLRDVGEKVEKVAQNVEDIVLESTITFVAKPGTVTKTFYAKENHLYKITFDRLWDISDFGSTNQLPSDVILNIITRNPLVYYADVRRKNWGFLDTTYYLYGINKQVEIIARGTEGETVGVKVTDVTNITHNKEVFDIAFFDTQENNVMESMLVKLEKGQVARYRINATSGFTYMKAYNRAVRNDDYKITELVADESGYVEGDYFAVNVTYIVICSVKSTGFTPKFRVYEEGKASNDGIKYPYQLVFDTENIRPIISLTDEGNHYYDNSLINFGQIISKTDIVNGTEVKRLYLLYQGYGTAVVGTDGEPVSNILMAYSEDDGETWTRGIPNGDEITIPYPDANVARINGTTTYNNNTGETTTTGGTTVSTINNVIFKRGRIVGEVKESSEVINEFAIAKVSDSEYPYRMVASVRNGTKVDGTISGQKNYMFKSNNLVNWKVVGKVTEHAHDSICSIISYGDKLLIFIRMWKFKERNPMQNVEGVRLIGSMWLDIEGNVIQPPSGLFGDFLYNPAATQIGAKRFLFLPTRLIPTTSIMVGDNVNEAYIMDKGKVRWCPCYNIDRLNQQPNDNSGWNYVAGIVAIGTKQYVLYGQRQSAHSESTVTEGNSELRLCPVEWVTYDKYNVVGG